ncbi:hypothetical protein FHX57_006768 [Paraburkholderia tropica]|uniref:hypothetical protein n=1 Tax=Paraburkholderia tropica TaxID=92647 RepID=UPI001607A2FA|nr:hypothetical protein [Paraburkholderia tropica]MBB3004386.1 hypothetical protein [Paraburkholderia tropica]
MNPFLAGLATGFILGTFAWLILVILIASHRTPTPTLRRRQFRDQPLPDGVDDPARVQSERNVGYEWINIAGECE